MAALMASTSSQRLLTVCSAPCCRTTALRFQIGCSTSRRYATEASPQDVNVDDASGHGSCSVKVASTSTSDSDLSQKQQWKRPLPEGVLPAYDAAVAYIARDGKAKREQAEALQEEVDELSAKTEHANRLAQMRKRIQGLLIAAEVNDPETRWRHREGQSDMSKPVFRYLAESEWRKQGRLGTLMQRVTQMSVVPDVLARIDPDLDLQIWHEGGEVAGGSMVEPSQTMNEPQIKLQIFDAEEQLYTLLMVDPDSPDAARDGFKTVCHWAVCDVPLKATTRDFDPSMGNTLLAYIPPHPQKGTPYHRYTYLLCRQGKTLSTDASIISHDAAFSVRGFMHEHSLQAVGISFYREVWSEHVSHIYHDILKKPEVAFGRPKRVFRPSRASHARVAAS